MAIVRSIVKNVLEIKNIRYKKRNLSSKLQEETLKKLLKKAKNTAFGEHYKFKDILESQHFIKSFQQNVPIYDYDKIFDEWWHRLLKGESDVCWPGKVNLFGLTSGTSNDSSKRVPVSSEMISAIRKVGIRQFFTLTSLKLPARFYEKKILMLGGSTDLLKVEDYFEGDLSGILTDRFPSWFNRLYKPGKPISGEKDWNVKLEKMVKEAPNWDIGGIAGVPAWVQILLEKIIEHYNLKNIHEIWPNFAVYVHGGVCFDPYKKSFEKTLGKKVYYLETYLASEGFLAFQSKMGHNMQLVIDNGIFFEFLPFDNNNFTMDGQLKESHHALLLNEVKENTEYALVISTVAGSWRYIIGDTIKFTSVKDFEIVITGRTKHFLSLCGEHLSVDNMNKAINMVSDEMNIDIKEFTVAGINYENLFAHKWYIGLSNPGEHNKEEIKQKLDTALRSLNDDYCVERSAALKEVFVELLPDSIFYDWLRSKGKEGGQHKFPRVINVNFDEWENFIKKYSEK